MSLKKKITSCILGLGVLPLMAQYAALSVPRAETSDYEPLFVGKLEPAVNLSRWLNNPYWENSDFTLGEVSYLGVVYVNVRMRYDAFRQHLVVLMAEKNINVEPNQSKIDYFVMNGKTFIPEDGRFVCIEYDGPKLRVVHDRRKVPAADQLIDGKIFHDYEEKNSYSLRSSSDTAGVKGLRDVQKAYPEFKKQLKTYSRSNRLRFSSKTMTSDLVSLASYLETLLPRSNGALARVIERIQPADTLRAYSWQTVEGFEPETTFPALTSFSASRSWLADDDDYINNQGISDLEPVREDKILDEIEVTGFHEKVAGVQMGVEKFRPALLKNVPLALGESDVLKMIQTLPGVKTVGEASSGFNVRGGASDQNLILLNGGTIFNPMHMFGLFSAFNSDMISDAELYKSSVPSQYGGRISSVMNITSKVADKKEWHGSASIGLLTSKAYVEAPLVRDRLSILVSGRTTYSDWMLRKLPKKSGYRDGNASFYDLGGVLSYTASRKHRINLHGYYSHDSFAFDPYHSYAYSNLNYSAEWRAYWNENLNSTVTAGSDSYGYQNDESEVASSAARLSFDIGQYFLKSVFTHSGWEGHVQTFGFDGQLYRVLPGKYAPIGDKSVVQLSELQHEKALEGAFFVDDEWKLTSSLTANIGLRWSLFSFMNEGDSKLYQAPEVRLSSSYTLTQNSSVKLAFNTMHQYLHKVSNTSIMSPTDVWKLSDSAIRPQSGWQIASGYYWQTDSRSYEASAEVYYKKMSNYLTYRSSGVLLMNPDLAADVISTDGRAYGVEFMVRKPTGRINGWASYSYSRTQLRQVDNDVANKVNGGRWFNTEYDRPHEFKFVGNFKLTQRYSFSANADYSTGRPVTIPAGQYFDHSIGEKQPYYTERNGYRLPDYCRVDASFNIEPNHHLTQLAHSSFSIGVYNLLGRKNAYSVYYLVENGKINGYKLSIFGAPIPFVSYNIKF